ncbi:ornithine cyclodeaminase family protein [Virgibacillus siamensis]|uniref:ornithine cyclodeaminase family protein n=1 Tax=Virgibacillus siamensis TaxID=480071 RepID=UPI0009868D44|nr:ornithine cyclodeaminase family protein [Virgibacillus siamensis]
MLFLTDQEIQENYFMQDAVEAIKEGLAAKNKGLIQNPHRTVIEIPDKQASALYMPSADLENQVASVKVVNIFPNNPADGKPTTQGVLMLSDASDGRHICTMDASYLTRLRTGALSSIATSKLAREDAKVLGVVGTGAMAFEQVLGVLEARTIETIVLFNRTIEKARTFKEKLIHFGVAADIQIVDKVKNAVQASDIINCSTRSKVPVFDGNDLKDGTHINGIGSFLPSMQEVDLSTIKKATIIAVDDLESVKEEAGELIHADQSGEWRFSDVYGELSDFPTDGKLIRKASDEITFFKSVGAAYFDLEVAKGIYQKAKESGFGTKT